MGVGAELRSMLDTLEAHDGVTLSPVERLLLATDGTVTHMLEALVKQPVSVDILKRYTSGSTLHRQVALRRSRDQSPLVWAESQINLHPLSVTLEDELVAGDVGIGTLLRQEYTETHRSIEDMDAVWHDTADLPEFIDATSSLYLKRRYKVYSDDSRIMTITEYFPKGLL